MRAVAFSETLTFSVLLGCCSFSGMRVTGIVYLILSHEGTRQLAFDKSEDLQPVLFWRVSRAVGGRKMLL